PKPRDHGDRRFGEIRSELLRHLGVETKPALPV
ncbi:MAG: sulfonate ABC transporter ATP-binding protein, partial [Mesorhizobium sp.]